MQDALVIGGGITGLTLAYQLQKQGLAYTLLEASDRVGGWIQTHTKDNTLFERGPRSCRSTGSGQATLQLASELGLTNQIVWGARSAKRRFLYCGGHLRPLSPFRAPYCVHLWKELLKERHRPITSQPDESVHAFFSRRFSPTIAEVYAGALTTGIYAGDTRTLSARACFPTLWEMEQQYGSLIRGMFKKKAKGSKKDKGSLFSFDKGMETLPQALGDRLDGVVVNARVTEIDLYTDHVEVTCGQTSYQAAHLFVTIPAAQLAPLLPAHISLQAMPTTSVAVVNVHYSKNVLRKKGFGYLIPPREDQALLGVVWDSSIFPQQHPLGTTLTVMMGGAHRPDLVMHSKETLLEIARRSLAMHMGIREAPTQSLVAIAENAIPQYPVGHLHNLEVLRAQLAPYPTTIVGSSYTGVAVNDCIKSAMDAADAHCG